MRHFRGGKPVHFAELILAPALLLAGVIALATLPLAAQVPLQTDRGEPLQNKPNPKILPRPAGTIQRDAVEEKSMRAMIERLVACGTRNSLSSWDDPKRGAGCGRDQIVARLNEIANASGGKLQVVVDKFEVTAPRTAGKPVPLENVYAIVPGTDPKLAKTVFLVSGHLDSR